MSYTNILVRSDGPVLHITVNRPRKLNALNRKTVQELTRVFREEANAEAVRVVILTGSGDQAFVAGADISEIRELTPVKAREFSMAGQELMLDIQQLGKPVIAAINGYALGGGCELALACTLRLASTNASLGLPEINLGIMPGFGGTQRLGRLIGPGRALEMALTGEMIDAEQALDWGLVTGVYEPQKLEAAAEKLASKLARSAPHAMDGIMTAVNQGLDLPLQAGLEIETDRFALCCATQDMKEGTGAFLDKRKPRFTGR